MISIAASIDSYLADPSRHDPSFMPQEQLFPDWRRELSSYGNHIYGYPYIALTTFLGYRKDLLDDPVYQRNFKFHRIKVSVFRLRFRSVSDLVPPDT